MMVDHDIGTENEPFMNDRDRPYLQTPEQWTRFLSAFVHELRTPIASSRMLADLLAEAPPDRLGDQERRYCENILEVVLDLQALVGDVAELARLLAGRALIRPAEVSLEQLVDKATEAVRPRTWEGGITLTDSMDPALPKLFRTDPDRLRQALVLLLGAAISHAEGASQGLFEPFYDGIRSTRPRGGRSLALPLASELARALGGMLQAENRGERPTFELSVPAAGA
jgi:signal transduction histidine kinase